MNEKKQDKHKATKFDKRSMLAAATTAFGIVKDWKLEDLKSASSLATMMKPKDLKELDIGVVSAYAQSLAYNNAQLMKAQHAAISIVIAQCLIAFKTVV